MLVLDLAVMNRRPEAPKFRQALALSAVWIALAASFGVLEFFWHGRAQALQFVTGYVIELSLSVDNLFVFLLIFRYFKVPSEHERKILFWGILGALVMRGVFIAAGVGLIQRFEWITYIFGAVLVFSGAKLFFQGEAQVDPDNNLILKVFRKFVPVTNEYAGSKFFIRRETLYATPLFVVLLIVETTDILFAVDSIPAVLAVTLNAFIVYTSNVFAILGLRSMYFAMAGMLDRFHYLHYGLSIILIIVGLKMLASHFLTIPTEWTLGAVLLVLAASVVASIRRPRQAQPSS